MYGARSSTWQWSGAFAKEGCAAGARRDIRRRSARRRQTRFAYPDATCARNRPRRPMRSPGGAGSVSSPSTRDGLVFFVGTVRRPFPVPPWGRAKRKQTRVTTRFRNNIGWFVRRRNHLPTAKPEKAFRGAWAELDIARSGPHFGRILKRRSAERFRMSRRPPVIARPRADFEGTARRSASW